MLLVVVAAAAVLWAVNALVIASLFAFRTRDVLRLAVHFLVRTPGVTVGNAAAAGRAAAVTRSSSEAVLALLAVLFVLAYLRVATPMTDIVRKDFTG